MTPSAARSRRLSQPRAFYVGVGILVLLATLVFALQERAGAYGSGFGEGPGDSGDESAHYVSGRMVSAYLHNGLGHSPIHFAEQFYLHYPEVAIGHWPPFFYVMQSAWGVAFGGSRNSIIAMVGFLAALLGFSIFWRLQSGFGWQLAAAASILFVFSPVVQRQDTVVMAEIPVALFAYISTLALTRYIKEPCWRCAISFATFTTLAALTKGNGLALLLIPIIAFPLCRKVALMFRKEFVLSCLAAAIVIGAWYIPTKQLAGDGVQVASGIAFIVAATIGNGRFIVELAGGGAFLLAAIGFWNTVCRKPPTDVEPRWATATALVVSVFVFHTLVEASIAERHLITTLPSLLEFTVAGAAWLANLSFLRRRLAAPALALIIVVQFFALEFSQPHFVHRTFQRAALYVGGTSRLWPAVMLVSSDRHDGEGMFVAEMAEQRLSSLGIIVRASKVLAESSWLDKHYRLLHSDPKDVESYLDSLAVNVLVLETGTSHMTYPHHQLLLATIHTHPAIWTLDHRFREVSGPHAVEIYRRLAPIDTSVKTLRIEMPFTLKRSLQLDPSFHIALAY